MAALAKESIPRESRGSGETAFRLLVAGGMSGVVTKSMIAPLERIKIVLQVQNMADADGMAVKDNAKYRGIVGTLRRLYVEEGIRGLWRGNFANCARVVPVYALKFALNDTFKAMSAPADGSKPSFPSLVASGAMAGCIQAAITHPLDTIRARLTMPSMLGEYSGIISCAKDMVRTEGWSSLYKGLGPTLLSATPYVGLQMGLFTQFSSMTEEWGLSSAVGNLLCGAGAGVIAQTITFPGDVVRRRMQLSGLGGKKRLYSSSIDAIRKIYKHEGLGAFFAGARVNALRSIPGAAIQFATYQYLRELLLQ